MKPDPENLKYEQLSAYLDGELNGAESTQIERQLATDPELQQTLESWRASRASFSQLPQYQLPKSFAENVMAKLETTPVQTTPEAIVSNSTGRSRNWAIGLVVSLASMLLVTVLIPSLYAPSSTNSATATANSTQTEPVDEVPTKSTTEPSTKVTPEENVRQPRDMVQPALAMRTGSRDQNSGVVGSVKLVLDEILLIDFATEAKDKSQRLKRALMAAFQSDQAVGIRVLEDPKATPGLPNQFATSKSTSAALIVIARRGEMKDALAQLADSEEISISAISLEPGAQMVDEVSVSQSLATAQSVPVFDLNKKAQDAVIDPADEKLLDDWFGLSSEPNNDALGRFLILVK
ncbi:MAG: sigma-E factor negative regulatory protein [Planctomycetota bacterium]